MILRKLTAQVEALLREGPAVALLGPRQVGKTTLAREVASRLSDGAVYLDLERPADRELVLDPLPFLSAQAGKLVIIDEVQKAPELFAALRGIIDDRRRAGHRTGQFLLLGSASRELLRQSSESLTGRIAYCELTPLRVDEARDMDQDTHWLRGGYPESLLANSEASSFRWRQNYITQYLERDVPLLGIRTPTETLRRMVTMIAHGTGSPFNASQLAASLGLVPTTITNHVDMLADLMLVRRLQPWFANVGKRLVKSPKVYLRDSGLIHATLNLPDLRAVLSHPVMGFSWEAFVIEQLASCVGTGATCWYYRTSAGAEIDLLLEFPGSRLWAIEIKRSTTPKAGKGFHIACDDLKPERRIIIYSGDHAYSAPHGLDILPLRQAIAEAISKAA
jgi:uncharacterized protein